MFNLIIITSLIVLAIILCVAIVISIEHITTSNERYIAERKDRYISLCILEIEMYLDECDHFISPYESSSSFTGYQIAHNTNRFKCFLSFNEIAKTFKNINNVRIAKVLVFNYTIPDEKLDIVEGKRIYIERILSKSEIYENIKLINKIKNKFTEVK